MSSTIKIDDKVFTLSVSEEAIQKALIRLAQTICNDIDVHSYHLLAVLDGAFVFCADLVRLLPSSLPISFVKLSSYEGLKSTGNVVELIGVNKEIEGKNVLILEDIVDTGATCEKLLKVVREFTEGDIKIAAMFFKPNVFQGAFKVDYVGMNLKDDFVVGYGLDYNGKGRGLKDLYKLFN